MQSFREWKDRDRRSTIPPSSFVEIESAILRLAPGDRAAICLDDSHKWLGPEARAARPYDGTVSRPPLQDNYYCFMVANDGAINDSDDK